MKKLIISFVLAFAALTAYAGETSVDTSNLSDAQIAEIKAMAANKAAENAKQKAVDAGTAVLPKDPTTMATVAATWGQQAATAAEGFAHALAIAAKELGVTINEFLETPAGKLTAILIVWKVAGSAIIHILLGIAIGLAGGYVCKYLYNRVFVERVDYIDKSYFWGLIKTKKGIKTYRNFKDLSDGEYIMCVLITGLSVIVCVVSGNIII